MGGITSKRPFFSNRAKQTLQRFDKTASQLRTLQCVQADEGTLSANETSAASPSAETV